LAAFATGHTLRVKSGRMMEEKDVLFAAPQARLRQSRYLTNVLDCQVDKQKNGRSSPA
jgi:hypothetical protein